MMSSLECIAQAEQCETKAGSVTGIAIRAWVALAACWRALAKQSGKEWEHAAASTAPRRRCDREYVL